MSHNEDLKKLKRVSFLGLQNPFNPKQLQKCNRHTSKAVVARTTHAFYSAWKKQTFPSLLP